MDYKIEPGQISKSYGIDLAQNIGLPRDVIDKARKFAEGLEKFEEQIVSSQKGMEIEPEKQPALAYSINYETKLKIISVVNDAKEKYGDDIPADVRRDIQTSIRALIGVQ